MHLCFRTWPFFVINLYSNRYVMVPHLCWRHTWMRNTKPLCKVVQIHPGLWNGPDWWPTRCPIFDKVLHIFAMFGSRHWYILCILHALYILCVLYILYNKYCTYFTYCKYCAMHDVHTVHTVYTWALSESMGYSIEYECMYKCIYICTYKVYLSLFLSLSLSLYIYMYTYKM